MVNELPPFEDLALKDARVYDILNDIIRTLNAQEPVKKDEEAIDSPQTLPPVPTREEMWDFLKSLPTPPINVELSGGMMMHYVNLCYDFMTRPYRPAVGASDRTKLSCLSCCREKSLINSTCRACVRFEGERIDWFELR